MTKFSEWTHAVYDETIVENPFIDFELYPKQELVALTSCQKQDTINEFLTGGPGGGGKDLSLDTLIPTIDGFKTMEELMIGDIVFDKDGKPCKVVFKSDIFFNHNCYKITFDDGSTVIAGEDHLWVTDDVRSRDSKSRKKNRVYKNNKFSRDQSDKMIRAKVRSTKEIARNITVTRGNRELNNFSIDNCKPLQLDDKELPIDPYILGLWLGDGISAGGGFVTEDLILLDAFIEKGYEITKWKDRYSYGVLGLKKQLRENNLLNNKHIPEEYLRASCNQRLALIQGLMDTDGNILKHGTCEFVQKNEQVIDGLIELIRSFGIKVNKTITYKSPSKDKPKKPYFKIKFTTNLPVFRLPRKLELIKENIRSSQKRRYIVSCERVESVPTQCIQVDSPSHTYLCTENFIPTHNTKLLAALALQFVEFPQYRCLVTRKNYRELIGTGSVFDIIKNIPDAKSRESGLIRVVFPSGAEIHFKAFNDESHKQDVKGESYHTILNDEASELPESVLRFLYRSLRKKVDDWIPLRFGNASNPGGESTDYLIEKYIDGDLPYIRMGYKDNPYIDNTTYEVALMELDYIDRKYQMEGDWKYKPSKGDLINRDEAEAQLTILNTPIHYQLISIDLAGKGRDKFAVVAYNYLVNGLEYIQDFNQTPSSNPEKMLLDFIIKHNPDPRRPMTSLIVIEQEGGGSPEYARKYFQQLVYTIGYNIPVVLKKPQGSKYQRARPLMHSISYGGTKLNKEALFINDFIDEAVELSPDGSGKSPNLVDSASLARNYLHTDVLDRQTHVTVGARIGG